MGELRRAVSPDAAPSHALAVRSFQGLWLNTMTFYMVSNALRFVYGWVVLDGLERSESWQGIVIFVLGLGNFFFLVPSGVWADRVDPKKMLLATQGAILIIMIGTAVALGSGPGTLTIAIVSAALAGVASAIGQPVRTSLVPALLTKDLLYSGIAINAIAVTLSLVLGAVSAKFFGDLFGFDGAFWWLAALIVVGGVAVAMIDSPGPATAGDKATMRQAMSEGTSFVRTEPGMSGLFALLSISGLLMMPLMFVTLQAFIKEELGLTAGDAAPVFAVMGVGIAMSSVVIMRREAMSNKSVVLMRAMMLGCTLLALMGQTTAYWQVMVLALIIGMCGGVFLNINQGLVQSNTPSELMGRVMGLYALVQSGLTPLGALALGFIAASIGNGPTLTLGAALALAIVVITFVSSRAIRLIN